MEKKKKNKTDLNGSLGKRNNIAERDRRGAEHAIDENEPKAPDGISGDWS